MISSLSRRQKKIFFLICDVIAVPTALWIAFTLHFGIFFSVQDLAEHIGIFAALTALAPFVFYAFRLPWIKLAALDLTAFLRIAGAAGVLAISGAFLNILPFLQTPFSVLSVFALSMLGLPMLTRSFALLSLRFVEHRQASTPVAIYGAGKAGMQLALALRHSTEVRPVVFVDDNPSLHGMLVAGLQVHPVEHLKTLHMARKIDRILLAIPSLDSARRKEILERLNGIQCDVQIMPSYVDLIAGKSNELRTVSPDELLGRDKVDLDIPEIAKAYAGRVVMVTGAGGSIGSELCRQLLECRPAHIILFEQSEYALYEIDRELRPLAAAAGISVTTRLGSVTNAPRVASVMADERVEIVLHAAAYKHVPLVEENELEGARNNVLGTKVVAEAAMAQGVERFILVSTDKAVRPTNIMGATKRMAELVIQDLQTRSTGTRFAMVRFGNVLGSSGSVLPLFQKQIQAGGPVTVTHPDVTRFFMTIPEAARLVLLAGAYAEGGDVFVLDMGSPMKIMDIARRMIEMSGAKIRDGSANDGIAIKVTGLRPGEKLYEELLIDNDSLRPTPHGKILRAEEAYLSQIEVAGMINDVQKAIAGGHKDVLRRTVQDYVDGYHRMPSGDQTLAS
ncbi:MAG: polysaccharide biosynthesis protein [Planktomarina sp.]